MSIEETFKALKLEQGGIYVLECNKELSYQQMENLKRAFDGIGERWDIRFIVLPPCVHVAREKAA